ncbi:SDR family oxidoreductase [Streptomyces sp. NRRL S-87]|uniref:SDR family oxidoreductase n=1 Tax=Streptomyces sp. NRRL S-87 TaxID=1463920 RepID=UPI00068ADC49|nr:SDR family oxidoreductase [Streptomyces sp. NRRL S-87]
MTAPGPTPPAAPTPVRSPLPESLAGATVVLVGGSSGIGLAAARLLSGLGARPVLVGRDADRLAAAAASVAGAARTAPGAPPAPVRTYVSDVRDEERLGALLGELGTVDHVLVSAGTATRGAVTATTREDVADSVEGRFWGAYAVARAATPRLAAGGSITYLSGVYVVRPVPNGAAVIAAAAAVEGLTKSLAVELAPRRIRVNAVRSGTADTPMLRRRLPDDAAVADAGRAMPLGRYGTAEEVAAAALFLMANAYVTGTVLTVDGGQSLL